MAQFDVVQDFVSRAQRLTRLDELKPLIGESARDLGFEFFAVLHHVDLALPVDGFVRFSNYPSGFVQTVQDRRYFIDDPVLLASQRTAAGFEWTEVPKLVEISQRQADIIALGAKEGLGPGYTVPNHVPGEYAGSSSFAVRSGLQLPSKSLPFVHYLGAFAFEAGRRLIRAAATRRADMQLHQKLTDRQMDCLVLAGRGVSAHDAGAKLGIKQGTVEKHLQDAKDKFGVHTTTELVVRALFDGRITFGDLLRF